MHIQYIQQYVLKLVSDTRLCSNFPLLNTKILIFIWEHGIKIAQ